MKNLGEKTLAFLIGLLSLAVLAEAGLRLSGALRLAEQRRLGDAVLQERNGYRILCLGESTTANQYPALLQQRLDRAGGGSPFSVIDGGVGGVHSSFILSRLKDNLDHYRPDMVVVMMGSNDPPTLLPPPYRPSVLGFSPQGPLKSLQAALSDVARSAGQEREKEAGLSGECRGRR
jgi:hypothetical protein